MSHSCLMVSTVGTTMELNCASLGITNLAPGSTQLDQLPVLPWNLKSWMPDDASGASCDWRFSRPPSS